MMVEGNSCGGGRSDRRCCSVSGGKLRQLRAGGVGLGSPDVKRNAVLLLEVLILRRTE